ncbi:GNAT family N-acetyltransferase [Shewanella septentrionalis]|uniref:GNAT family N-acetyltransferase n=1 Tax=Shewanella septentrionalis TaxID=2952223 RepID=A0A9X2WZV2_9GAMM|nr:GNAT family N-acetyltransferase [Shewanella septentrionalis]MCT7948164.1 GNAT family N-acetyltransferase [Shewanella septentrionalis]
MVKLQKAKVDTFSEFKTALQDSFRVAAEADLGLPLEEPIPSNEDIDQSIAIAGAATYWFIVDDQRVGGAVVLIDEITNRNSLSFFFISTSWQSRGLGLQAWKAIQSEYPNTKIWETVTPYFEKRNIHFYVNRCGFKIVEFYNKFHPDPNQSSAQVHQEGDEDEMFRFMKVMDPECD